VNIAVDPKFSVTEGHNLGCEARHKILHHLPYLSNVIVHVDPNDKSGESFHQIEEHTHDEHQSHFHP
jgi:divalent metal cation (Fe/Co/Zn/Cd) transporter